MLIARPALFHLDIFFPLLIDQENSVAQYNTNTQVSSVRIVCYFKRYTVTAHYICAGADFQCLTQSFPVFLSDAHSDHASSVFIKSIARLLSHNKLTLFCTQSVMCVSNLLDLIVNKALKVIFFRGVEYFSEYVFFVALDLPPVIFIELCALKSKERHFLLLRKTVMSRVKIIIWQNLKPTDHLHPQWCFSSCVGTNFCSNLKWANTAVSDLIGTGRTANQMFAKG